jgi:hypothetical protein
MRRDRLSGVVPMAAAISLFGEIALFRHQQGNKVVPEIFLRQQAVNSFTRERQHIGAGYCAGGDGIAVLLKEYHFGKDIAGFNDTDYDLAAVLSILVQLKVSADEQEHTAALFALVEKIVTLLHRLYGTDPGQLSSVLVRQSRKEGGISN